MKSPLLSSAVMALVAAAIISVSPPSAHAQAKSGATKNETFIVIKITADKVDYRAIGRSTLKDEQKRIQDEYTQHLKEYRDAVKSDPQTPKPVKPVVRTMPGATFETQKGAQDYAEKLIKEEEDKKDKDKPK